MLRKSGAFLSVILVTLTVAANDKSVESKDREVKTLSIDPKAFGDYPAVWASLDEGKLYTTDKNGDKSRDLKSPIDLWIEPRDPEIAVFRDPNRRAQLGILEVDFDETERLPEGIDWSTSRLKRSMFKSGFVFFVRSSSGIVYKVRIAELDRRAQTMELSYARLLPSASTTKETPQNQKAHETNARLVKPDTGKPSSAGQLVALRAVSDFFLEFKPDRATRFLAQNATYRSDNPGSIKQLINEITELHRSGKPFPAVREIGFFTSQDIPKIQKRLQVYKGADRMFDERRIPMYLKDGGFGCFVVTYPLENVGERGMTAVIVMVFQRIGDEYKIVYIDDN